MLTRATPTTSCGAAVRSPTNTPAGRSPVLLSCWFTTPSTTTTVAAAACFRPRAACAAATSPAPAVAAVPRLFCSSWLMSVKR